MDEKGFAIWIIVRSKRVFDKLLFGQRKYKQSLYDGNCEWVTLIATICANRSHLPLGIIFPAADCAVQALWVAAIDLKKHVIYFTT
jgi:hypothetical protein